jgi:hypothetical protein
MPQTPSPKKELADEGNVPAESSSNAQSRDVDGSRAQANSRARKRTKTGCLSKCLFRR